MTALAGWRGLTPAMLCLVSIGPAAVPEADRKFSCRFALWQPGIEYPVNIQPGDVLTIIWRSGVTPVIASRDITDEMTGGDGP